MLCQNCGRRSSDSKSFCQHCGAVASPDLPSTAPPRPALSDPPRRASAPSRPQARTPAQSGTTMRRAGSRPAQGGSNVIPTLIFWGMLFYGVYWFLSDDGRDLRSLLNDVLQQQLEQRSTEPAPVQRPPTPDVEAPSTPAPSAKPGATPAEAAIEGLSPAQVLQRLGRPASVITVKGVTGWSYQDGSLVVYFVKDRATLTPPR